MNFTHKTATELESMDVAQKDAYLVEKAKYDKYLITEATTKAVTEALKGLPTKEEIETLKTANIAQGEEIAKLKDKGGDLTEVSLLSEVTAKKTIIKDVLKGRVNEVIIKAPTIRASITDTNSRLAIPGFTQIGVRNRGLYDLFRKIPFGNGDNAGTVVYSDWDEKTCVRAAAMVAEGAKFPESTAKFKTYKIDLKKIGDTLPVSDEFGEDEVSAAAELDMFLRVNMQSKEDDLLVNGDGIGDTIQGLKASIPSYVAVPGGIPSPNIYDLVKKVKTDITFNRGSKYKPNFVVFNDNVADMLHLEKDKNDNYIFPDKMNIGSISIVIDNNFTDNELAVGDSNFGTIYEKGGVTLEKVWVNEQAIEDMVTLKARKRMLFLIKNGDASGFRMVEDVAAALLTLAAAV